jgi:hypothetical protein
MFWHLGTRFFLGGKAVTFRYYGYNTLDFSMKLLQNIVKVCLKI